MQEISGEDRREAGRIPRTIECELTADLVDSCVPGDMVTITAVVKATGSEEGQLYEVHLISVLSLEMFVIMWRNRRKLISENLFNLV